MKGLRTILIPATFTHFEYHFTTIAPKTFKPKCNEFHNKSTELAAFYVNSLVADYLDHSHTPISSLFIPLSLAGSLWPTGLPLLLQLQLPLGQDWFCNNPCLPYDNEFFFYTFSRFHIFALSLYSLKHSSWFKMSSTSALHR